MSCDFNHVTEKQWSTGRLIRMEQSWTLKSFILRVPWLRGFLYLPLYAGQLKMNIKGERFKRHDKKEHKRKINTGHYNFYLNLIFL